MNNTFKKWISKLLPAGIKQIWHSAKYVRYITNGDAEIIYSQQGEDLAIARFFPNLNNGFYVDIGAYDPVKYSNTYKLYQKGWRGINIEPNPDQIEKFKALRNGDVNLNVGVSNQNAVLKYYGFNKPAVNTFVKANADQWAKVEGFELNKITEIETVPLAEILRKYVEAGTEIHLMNIDVEGMDIEVLTSNDWDNFRPQLILVEEMWHTKALQESEVYRFLYKNNYSLWNIVGVTMLFADNGLQIQNK